MSPRPEEPQRSATLRGRAPRRRAARDERRRKGQRGKPGDRNCSNPVLRQRRRVSLRARPSSRTLPLLVSIGPHRAPQVNRWVDGWRTRTNGVGSSRWRGGHARQYAGAMSSRPANHASAVNEVPDSSHRLSLQFGDMTPRRRRVRKHVSSQNRSVRVKCATKAESMTSIGRSPARPPISCRATSSRASCRGDRCCGQPRRAGPDPQLQLEVPVGRIVAPVHDQGQAGADRRRPPLERARARPPSPQGERWPRTSRRRQ